jgi:hypothetical protein
MVIGRLFLVPKVALTAYDKRRYCVIATIQDWEREYGKTPHYYQIEDLDCKTRRRLSNTRRTRIRQALKRDGMIKWSQNTSNSI